MKMNKFKLGLIAIALAAPTTAMAEFNYTGYMRTGGGMNIDGQNVNKVDEHRMGRFGNEYDTYIAAAFTQSFKRDNGLWAYYHLEFNRWDGDMRKSGGFGETGDWENDRNYLKMGGFKFLPEGSAIWVGSRKQEADFHILDYKWRRLMGTGFGYESKNFDIQFLQNDSGASTNEIPEWRGQAVASHTIAARASSGKLQGELVYTTVADFDDVDLDAQGVAETAFSLNINYGLPFGKVVAQYGQGVDHEHLGWNEALSASEDDVAYKVTLDTFFTPAPGLDVNAIALYESFDADAADETYSALVGAVRVHKTIDESLAWIAEGVVTNIENKGGNADADGIQYKLAVGPSLQIDAGFWARPVSRLMFTYIGGDEEVVSFYEGEDSEFRFGYEFEIWF